LPQSRHTIQGLRPRTKRSEAARAARHSGHSFVMHSSRSIRAGISECPGMHSVAAI